MTVNLSEVILSTPSAVPSSSVNPDLSVMVSGVVDLAEILSKYGPFIGILSVFLIIFLAVISFSIWSNKKMMKRILEKDANMEDLSQDLLNKIVTSVLGSLNNAQNQQQQLPQNNSESENKRDLVGRYIDVNIAFKDASRIAINTLKCERVAIYVFHNGSTSIHGLSFFKMSCVHEWTMKGSRAMRTSMHSGMPLHAFSNMIETLYRTGECAISDISVKDIVDDHTARFVEYTDIKSMFLLGIKDTEENLAGFVIAEYRDPVDFADEVKHTFVKQALTTTIDNIRSIIIDESFQKRMNDD